MKMFLLTSALLMNGALLHSEPADGSDEMQIIFQQFYRDDSSVEEIINRFAVFVLKESEDGLSTHDLIEAYKNYVRLPEGEGRYVNILESKLDREDRNTAYELAQDDHYMKYHTAIDTLNQAWHEETYEILRELAQSLAATKKANDKPEILNEKEILQLNSKNIKDFLKSKEPLIIDFYAPWCKPCRMLSVIYKELNHEYGHLYRFAKLNVEDEAGISKSFRVKSLPTLVFIENGKEVGRHTGLTTKAELLSIIQNSFDHL